MVKVFCRDDVEFRVHSLKIECPLLSCLFQFVKQTFNLRQYMLTCHVTFVCSARFRSVKLKKPRRLRE